MALHLSNPANSSSFASIAKLEQGLYQLDSLHGLSYGGAATAVITPPERSTPFHNKKSTSGGQSGFIYKDAWIGATELSEKHARILC